MIPILWKRYNSYCDTYELGNFLLKRKLMRGGMVYEIWMGRQLNYSSRDYSDFLRNAQPLLKLLLKQGV